MDLIWDFDGTLFDTYPLMSASLQQAMQEEGKHAELSEIRAHMAVSMGHTLQHYRNTLGITDVTLERYKELVYRSEKGAAPFDGVAEICERVCREGGRNHLCTHRGPSAKMYMDAWGLSQYFEVYVTSDDGLPRKPAPDMVKRILDRTGRPCEDFLMLGDRELDIQAAHGAGVRACLFTNGQMDVQTEAEFVLSDFSEFFDLIQGGRMK